MPENLTFVSSRSELWSIISRDESLMDYSSTPVGLATDFKYHVKRTCLTQFWNPSLRLSTLNSIKNFRLHVALSNHLLN